MIRHVIAFLVGFLTFSITGSIALFVLMNLEGSPLSAAFQAFDAQHESLFFELIEKSVWILILFVLPFISFVAAIATGFVCRKQEYLIAALSVTPYYVIFFVLSGALFHIYSLCAFVTMGATVIFGAFLSKGIKRSLLKHEVRKTQ